MEKVRNVGAKIILGVLILSVVAVTLQYSRPASAAALENIRLESQRTNGSYNANFMTFSFDLGASTNFEATDTISLTFNGGYQHAGTFTNTQPEDYEISINGVEQTVVAAGCGATDQIEITSVDTFNNSLISWFTYDPSTDYVTLTFTACGGFSTKPNGSTIEISLGGSPQIGGVVGASAYMRNPGFVGTYAIDFTAAGDTGTYNHVVRNRVAGANNAPYAIMTTTPGTANATTEISIPASIPPADSWEADEYFELTLSEEFALNASWQTSDFQVQYYDNVDALQTYTIAEVLYSEVSMPTRTCSGNELAVLVYNPASGSPVFKIQPCATFSDPANGPPDRIITIYGTTGTGTGTITNPDGSTSSVTSTLTYEENGVRGTFQETFFTYFDNEISVSASVDPAISFDLESSNCLLGVLSTGSLSSCEVGVTFNTNAAYGLNLYVQNLTSSGFALAREGASDGILNVSGSCSNTTYTTQATCTGNGGTWTDYLTAGVKGAGWAVDVSNDSEPNGFQSVGCSNPAYNTEASCTGNGATWAQSSCTGLSSLQCAGIGGMYAGGPCIFTDKKSCDNAGGTWNSACLAGATNGNSTIIGTNQFDVVGSAVALGSLQYFASIGATVTANLCFTAGIDDATPAGAYSGTYQFTAVGNF